MKTRLSKSGLRKGIASMLEAMPHGSPGRSNSKRVKRPIRLFPRLATGEEIAALEKLAWNAPHFVAEVRPAKREVDFTFRISIPKLPKRYRALQSLLFPPNTESWESVSRSWQKAFQSAFSKAKYNNKDFAKFVASPLHKVFMTGIQEWLHDEFWDVLDKDGKPIGPTRLVVFKEKSRVLKNQPDPRAALWVARKWHRYFPAARGLRSRLKNRVPPMGPAGLRHEINKVLPYGLFLAALRQVSGDQNADPRECFNTAWLSTELLVAAMLEAELKKKHYDPEKISVKTYLRVGNELLSLISSVPKPLF